MRLPYKRLDHVSEFLPLYLSRSQILSDTPPDGTYPFSITWYLALIESPEVQA